MVIIFIVLDSKNIIVVEDDLDIRELISFNLANEGHQVFEANNGEVGIDKARNNNPDLILLDLMLPGIQGLDVCRIIKSDQETKEIPIIMVTALGQEEDIVKGLETGADDYVTKPYSVTELMARIKTQLRRSRSALIGQQMQYGDIILDETKYQVFRDGQEINLGPTEFRLLSTLMERQGRVLSRDQLLDYVWGRDIYVDTRTVDVHIGRLRKSLVENGHDDPIRTIRGVGYALG